VIAPRHPERGGAIVAMLQARGLCVAQRSQGELPTAATAIYVADTIGELGTLYSLAPVAFLGKSLVGTGGQNPIEAMRFGAAVLTGPATGNFAETYAMLRQGHGVVDVTSAADVAAVVTKLLTDDAAMASLHAGAQKSLDKLSGALAKTLAALLELLPPAGSEPKLDRGPPPPSEQHEPARLQRAS
jgi:3-deoxy-D-manno-octulosonic-acid transferase